MDGRVTEVIERSGKGSEVTEGFRDYGKSTEVTEMCSEGVEMCGSYGDLGWGAVMRSKGVILACLG